MKPQVTYNRKLAGSVFLALRILFDLAILVGCAINYLPIKVLTEALRLLKYLLCSLNFRVTCS